MRFRAMARNASYVRRSDLLDLALEGEFACDAWWDAGYGVLVGRDVRWAATCGDDNDAAVCIGSGTQGIGWIFWIEGAGGPVVAEGAGTLLDDDQVIGGQ
jgi:hypothetical protein